MMVRRMMVNGMMVRGMMVMRMMVREVPAQPHYFNQLLELNPGHHKASP